MTPSSPVRKSILVVGVLPFDIEDLRKGLAQFLDQRANPVFAWTNDQRDACRKMQYQKFDAIVIDMEHLNSQDRLLNQEMMTLGSASGKIFIQSKESSPPPMDLRDAEQILSRPYTMELLVRALAKTLVAPPKIQSTDTKTQAFAVDARVLNALVKSTCFICRQFGLEQVKILKVESKAVADPWKGDIAAMIGINSRLFQGSFLISFEAKTYLHLLGQMLGEEFQSINAENADAIGELSNMILGNAKSDFTQYDVGMSLPRLLEPGTRPETPPGAAAILIPAETPQGRLYMEVIAHRLNPGLPKAS